MVLISFFIVVFNNLKKILAISLGVGIFMFLLATILPKSYTANSVGIISVGANKSSMSGISSMLSGFSIPGFLKNSLGSSGEQTDLVQTILESNTIRYNIIYHFKYDSIFSNGKKIKPKELLVKEFNKYFKAEIDDQNAIHVQMEDESPVRAADVANYAITFTDSMMNELSVKNAKKRLEFFDAQIQKQKVRLNVAEDAIRKFQEINKVALPKEQATATMEATMSIDVKILAAEVNIGILKQKYTENHPRVIEAKEMLLQLKKKRQQMVNNSPDNVLFPLANLPQIMVEFIRLKRDYMLQLGIYKTLLPELETAKMEQLRDIPSLQFVEKATPPERRSSPPRFIWTVLGFAFAFCTSIFVFCFNEYRSYLKQNEPQKASEIDELFNSMLSVFKI